MRSPVQSVSQAAATLSVDGLEALIRRIVREEVTRALEAWRFYEEPAIIEPGSPIDKDLTAGPHERAYAVQEDLAEYRAYEREEGATA